MNRMENGEGRNVELFPVGHATGKTLEIAGSGCAESHSISRSTNIFFGAGLRVMTGPSGRGCLRYSSRNTTVRWVPPSMRPLRSSANVELPHVRNPRISSIRLCMLSLDVTSSESSRQLTRNTITDLYL